MSMNRKLFRPADGIERVAGGAEDGAELSGTVLETIQVVLGVIKDLAAIGLIDAIVEIVTKLAAADQTCLMIWATAVTALATRKRPGSARISIGSGKRRSNSEFNILASFLEGGDRCRRSGRENHRRCRAA